MTEDLAIYNGFNEDPVAQALLSQKEKDAIRQLVVFAEENGLQGNILRQYVSAVIAGDDNIFSRTMELSGSCGASLKTFALKDIEWFIQFLTRHENLLQDYIPTKPSLVSPYAKSIAKIGDGFTTDAQTAFLAIAEHYTKLGRGLAAKYTALGWDKGLTGIEHFDSIKLDDLIGIGHQKEALTRNTERFLQGRGANNVLLFGDSGTGKSSCVKALINRYQGEGLRLIELKKYQMIEMEPVLNKLSGSKYRYIVFLDDLSFEEGEHGYKYLKAVLEGKAAAIPENVLFYATSNRRHLIRETWADRAVEQEEVHVSDTMQEKLSLSERFGLMVVFSSPTQAEYLTIVEGLCKKRSIGYTEDIKAKALQWAVHYNGRSGRTAKQFVSSLDMENI